MHASAFDFVRRVVQAQPPLRRVVEFGSRVINGSVKEIFTDSRGDYFGIDLLPGAGVDLAIDATQWNGGGYYDTVVCCEVMEHAPDIAGLCRSAYNALRPGGRFIVTCATSPRKPHSAEADGPPKPNEFYRNVEPLELTRQLRDAGFDVVLIDPLAESGDLHAFAMRVR